MAPTLTRRRKLDALGQPINSADLYRVAVPFTDANGVYNREVRLPGNHPGVTGNPSSWIPAGTDSFTVEQMYREALYPTKPARHEPDINVARPIPPARRMVALKSYHDRSGRVFDAGEIFDARDPFVRANPELFRKETDR